MVEEAMETQRPVACLNPAMAARVPLGSAEAENFTARPRLASKQSYTMETQSPACSVRG